MKRVECLIKSKIRFCFRYEYIKWKRKKTKEKRIIKELEQDTRRVSNNMMSHFKDAWNSGADNSKHTRHLTNQHI